MATHRRILGGKMYWASYVGLTKTEAIRMAKRHKKTYPNSKIKMVKENGKMKNGVALGSKKYPYVLWVRGS